MRKSRELRKMRKERPESGGIGAKIFRYAVMAIVLFISLYPIMWVLNSSYKEKPGGLGLPEKWVFDGYITIFTELDIQTYFFNSIVITFVSTLISVTVVAMAAYVVARMEFRGKALVTLMFSTTLFIPAISISFPIYRLLGDLGLRDTRIGVIFIYSGLGIAVTYFILQSYFMSIPKEMEEAARDEFYFASLLLKSPDKMTIPALLGQFTSAYSRNLNGMFSAIIVAVVPTIIVFCLLSETFVKSLTAGAVKG